MSAPWWMKWCRNAGEAGVQAEGAGVQQCGEGVVMAGASWKGRFLD